VGTVVADKFGGCSVLLLKPCMPQLTVEALLETKLDTPQMPW
jgi:hypothetical protein